MALFDSTFLKKLEYLSLVSRQMFRGQLLAQRRTMQLGGGLEFADHREYTPGDDFRHLDWNVFARHDELLLKRFQEEEDLHVYVLLDCSRSMKPADDSPKFDFARQMAAAMAYIALADLDRVAVSAFSEEIIRDFPLTRGKDRILLLLRFLEELEVTNGVTDLERVANSFVHRSQRRGVVIVVSDLFDPKGFDRGLDVLRHRGYEPHIVQMYDAAEANPELLGDLELYDVESGSIQKVTVTEKSLKQYRQLFEGFQSKLEKYARNYGIGFTATPTTIPFDEVVLQMMRRAAIVQ